ncbi:MAG TPA: CaiB/BaiF CoA-transferase family protein [Rhizomicrobium sp.]|nr:CaiB/BaiF CoA-transferase family protein [Rhizomicrobium sp.]
MSGYDFLSDVLVIEVAQLGPASLGGLLADMGANVIKVEAPPSGDAVRYSGPYSIGGPDDFGYLHMRWNRGKKSIGLDLRNPAGIDVFKKLAAKADMVIEGMRAGVMDKLGIGFEALREINPALVFCTLSGLGNYGPYARMASHGPAYDAFGGLGKSAEAAVISNYSGPQPPSVAMYAMGFPAAVGALSALHRARATGQSAFIEVAACDIAAHWIPDHVDSALNADKQIERPGFAEKNGRMRKWARLDNYRTADGKLLFLQAYYDRYWTAFTRLIEHTDLDAYWEQFEDADERIAQVLTELFATRTRADWLSLLQANDIPVMPVNAPGDLAQDPHFLTRNNVYSVHHPVAGEIRLSSTPIKTPDQTFSPSLAPRLGEHSAALLKDVLGLDQHAIEDLQSSGVVV